MKTKLWVLIRSTCTSYALLMSTHRFVLMKTDKKISFTYNQHQSLHGLRLEKTCFLHICVNKGTDQLCSYCTADQCLCFHYIDSAIPLPFSQLAILCCCTVRFVSDLVGNPKDRFCPDTTHNICSSMALCHSSEKLVPCVFSCICQIN